MRFSYATVIGGFGQLVDVYGIAGIRRCTSEDRPTRTTGATAHHLRGHRNAGWFLRDDRNGESSGFEPEGSADLATIGESFEDRIGQYQGIGRSDQVCLYVFLAVGVLMLIRFREKAPGQTECDAAIERITTIIRYLDQTALAAINQTLTPRGTNTEQVRSA